MSLCPIGVLLKIAVLLFQGKARHVVLVEEALVVGLLSVSQNFHILKVQGGVP